MNTCQSCTWWSPNRPEIQCDPELCLNPRLNMQTPIDFGCTLHLASDATEINVPQHTKNNIEMERNANPVDGPVEILIVSHAKDFPWLEYCLRALNKFCTGFQGVTVAHPYRDAKLFDQLPNRFGCRTFGYDEVEGKGMLQHMVVMATPEIIVPKSTRYVMHLDSDCIYHTPTTTEDYFLEDKPVYLVRSYDSLTTEDPRNPGSKVVSDCAQWKEPTERQLGFSVRQYTMCRHPTIFPRSFYKEYRERIQSVHGMPFHEFMLSGKNTHPQDRMDFTAMGAYAYDFMRGLFHWIDIEVNPAPKDRQSCFWSHGGISPEIRAKIEGFLA